MIGMKLASTHTAFMGSRPKMVATSLLEVAIKGMIREHSTPLLSKRREAVLQVILIHSSKRMRVDVILGTGQSRMELVERLIKQLGLLNHLMAPI